MKILSCNIRYCEADDGANRWPYRKEMCISVIRSREPDIICFQEMSLPQFNDLAAEFTEYQFYGMADAPTGDSPRNCIFYRRDGFSMIFAGGYFLSEKPHVAGSSSWNSACVRLANWVRLIDRENKSEFRVINTHLDHVSQQARENQARMIVEDSSAYPGDYPQILTGDMNCDSSNRAIDIFKSGNWLDTYASVHDTEDPGHTHHSFLGSEYDSPDGKIDWIFTKGKLKVNDAEIIKDSVENRFPSDHYFVSAELKT